MAIYRNPFLTRFSDRTGLKNSVFLSMYAPQLVSKLLKDEQLLLPKTSWIMGIPGSGKSSILRLFSIEILFEIIKHKLTYQHLYDILSDNGIITEDDIRCVGLYIPIDEFFSEAANAIIQDVENERLFFTLFDLRVAKQLINILEKINFIRHWKSTQNIIKKIPPDLMPPGIFSKDISTRELAEYIQERELGIAKILNSFPGASLPDHFEFHNRLSCFDLISAQKDSIDLKIILMVDDAHDLYPEQFNALKKAAEKRAGFPRWIATRKHIYSVNRLLGNSTNTTEGRDTYTVDLDSETIDTKLFKKFIKVLVDKRLKLTAFLNEFTSDQIEGFLSSVNTIDDGKKQIAIEKQRNEARKINKLFINKLPELEQYINGVNLDPEEAELLLIKAQRMANRRQLSLFPQIESLENTASKDKQAAKLFWKKRVGLPLYSGFEDLISISNQNVEQFLRVFSPVVDRLIYRVELDKNKSILGKEQKTLINKVATDYIKKIISRLYLGDKIILLVENLGNFFSWRTYEPNAPHAPGITQFALLASDIGKLEKPPVKQEWIKEMSNILQIAIAHNVIVPEGPKKQGARGSELKHVFSLNRLLCINYSLPLQKGDFQLFPMKLVYEMSNKNIPPNEIKRKRSGQRFFLEMSSD